MAEKLCRGGYARSRRNNEEGVELVLCILDATDGKSFAARVAA